MHSASVLLILFFQLVFAGAQQPNPSTVNTSAVLSQSEDAYKIYSILIEKEFRDSVLSAESKVLITGETVRDWNVDPAKCIQVLSKRNPAFHSLIDDYRKKNVKPVQLERKFHLRSPYQLLPVAPTMKESTDTVIWRHETVISFSAVGFSKDMSTALVYAEYSCGSLCAGGELYIFKKFKGEWKEQSKSIECGGWIS